MMIATANNNKYRNITATPIMTTKKKIIKSETKRIIPMNHKKKTEPGIY